VEGSLSEGVCVSPLTHEMQMIAEVILMRTVSITMGYRLEALVARLIDSRYTQHPPAGHMMHSFHINGRLIYENNAEFELTDPILSLIMLAPRLRAFIAHEMTVGRAELLCLSIGCTSTLTELDVRLFPRTQETLRIINSFRCLRKLWIAFRFADEEENSSWIHTATQPLNMPSVTDLWWEWEHGGDDERMAAFFASCTFGTDCRFQIEIPNLLPATVALLLPFFSKHSFKELTIDAAASAIDVLSPAMTNVPYIEFHRTMPPPSFFDGHTLPQTLTLAYPPSTDSDSFWDFLGHLSSYDRPPHPEGPTRLRIWWDGDNIDFDWLEDGGLEHTMFIGRLTRLAVALHRRGVLVTDEHGRDVTTLLKP
jgi:hypothetical protein